MRPRFVKPLSQTNRSLLSVSCCFLIMLVLWLGIFLDNSPASLAQPLQASRVNEFDSAIANRPDVFESLKDKVKDDLSGKARSVLGDSDSANLAEEAKSVTNQPKRSFDNSAKRIEATKTEVDGRTEENIAKIQGKATDSGHGIENAIEDVMSNIKDKVN